MLFKAEILTKTCFTVAILQNGGHIWLVGKWQHCFSDCLYLELFKNV